MPGLKDASYKPVTGEEEETCVLQVRRDKRLETRSTNPSVLLHVTDTARLPQPHSSQYHQRQLRSKLYRLTEVASDGAAAGASSSGGGGGGGGPRRDWVECGVGQAKILVPHPQPLEVGQVPAAARVVMRREPGTSVLINARIKPPLVTAAKHADKALRFTCLDEKGQPSTFLFRVRVCVRSV